MYFDPLYLAILLIGFVLSGATSLWTRSAFARWGQVATSGGRTGAQVAATMLRAEGLTDVRIEQVGGFLSDHYDPRTRTLRLSPAVFGERRRSWAACPRS